MKLPETWVQARLCDVLIRIETKIDPQTSGSANHFYVGLEHIESHTGRLLRDIQDFTESSDILSIKAAFQKGDILYGKLRPNLNKVHVAEQDGICSTDIWALRTSDQLLVEFALRYLRSPAIYVHAAQLAAGANLPRLSADAFDRLSIPLPTLPEQQRIVEVFRQAEAFGENRNTTEDTLQELTCEYYNTLFGDVVRNEKAWTIRKIGQVSEVVRGSSPRPQGDPRFFGGLIPRLMVSDLTRDGLWVNAITDSLTEEGAKSSRLMSAQSVVIAVSGVPGLTAILNHDACIHDGFVGLRDLRNDLLPEFVAYTLNLLRARIDQQAVGAVFRNLTTDQVKVISIPVPPLDFQQQFCDFLLQVRAVQQYIAKSRRLLSELFNSLTVEAFSGELTASWRERHQDELIAAATARDTLLRERGAKIINASAKAVATVTAQTDATVCPARHWLLGELSEFQRQVLVAFSLYCEQTGHPLLAEDPDVFAGFCDDEQVAERLQAFGPALNNRIRRTLGQLAALGLIAKVTLPKQNLETGEREYLKAFRPLRTEESTRLADVENLRKALGEQEGSA
ncbi:restriction endonuclease subunit S [Nitrosomonas sp. sh817]|uniref:restriction endonuclease subunit S n=1 Tax=Nitrosomonas sp. sh817 TaxID=3070658 RepID=UPI0027DAE290|nr:restriction endonuclease subunit S [Nitrosomonas sp. sh817]WMJ08604.1 restriction endonuclease subunit S [Nitrosomonas sp. sh817]